MAYEDRRRQQVIAEFHWRMAEAERQVEVDYPLARTVNNLSSQVFLEVVETLSKDDGLRLYRTMSKEDQPEVLAAVGERITPEEDAFHKAIGRRVQEIRQPRWLAAMNRAAAVQNPIKKPRAGSALVAGLKPLLGKPDRLSASDWLFSTPVGAADGWHLGTMLMLGTRHPYTARFHHSIQRWPQERMPMSEFSSISRMVLGEWRVATEDDVAPILEAMIGVSHFAMQAVAAIAPQIADHTPYPYPENDRYRT